MGERLVVQFARGSTRPPREFDGPPHRSAPRPRRTVHRMSLTGLPVETSWQVSNIPILLRHFRLNYWTCLLELLSFALLRSLSCLITE